MLNTRELMVQVCTTYWDREEQKYCHYRGWPAEGDPLDTLMAIQDMQIRKIKRREKPVAKVSLYTALTHHCNSSAYLVQYAPTSLNVRFKTGVFATGPWELLKEIEPVGINMILAIFDADCHKSRKDQIDTWFDEQRPKLDKLLADFPGLIIYRSQGGMRIIAALPKPIPMDGFDCAKAWTRLYGGWCNYLARKYDIKTEGSDTPDQLGDWTRFQRVPHDKRHKDQPAANFEIIGDLEKIGIWDPVLEESDYPELRRTSNSKSIYKGKCQLLSLVRRTGLQCDETQLPNAWDILCPDHLSHGTDTEFRSSMTYLYTDTPVGRIECKSSTCQRLHPDKGPSYLKCFHPDDVVMTTPVSIIDDPLVEKIWNRVCCRQNDLDWNPCSDEFQSNPQQEHDQCLLLKAIKLAAYPESYSRPKKAEFIQWITPLTRYADLKRNNCEGLNHLLSSDLSSLSVTEKEIVCEYMVFVDNSEPVA